MNFELSLQKIKQGLKKNIKTKSQHLLQKKIEVSKIV